MRTEELIRAMAADTERPRSLAAVLAAGLLIVAGLVAAVFLPAMGPRPDLGMAMMTPPVVVKQLFPCLVTLGGFGAALRLARPGMDAGGWALLLLAVPVLLGLAVAATMAAMPAEGWMPAMMGSSNGQCVSLITLMSLPFLAVALWALRDGASTRPALSGALAGLLAGGAAAVIYSVHCTEDSPLFYTVWYGLGIAIAAGIGALVGARILRW
jgi:hypothetical protein